MRKKNVCLMRVSTDVQETTSQRVAIEKYIKENHIFIDEWLEEDGVSGFKTKLENRVALMKLKEMALNDELDTLVVFNLDRIGRRMELVGFLTLLDSCNVKILSVTEGCLNDGNDTDILVNSIKMWVAEYESKKKSKAVKAGKKVSAMRGNFLGGKPNFGYTVKDKKLEIDEDEASIVRLLFDLYINKGTAKTIDKFEQLGIKRRGSNWTRANIVKTIKNTVYVGKKPLQDGEIPYDETLRIVSDEVFYKAQEMIKQRTSKSKGTSTKFVNRSEALLEGLLFHRCPDGNLRKLSIDYNSGTKKSPNKKLLYRCSNCKDHRYEGVQKSFGGKKLNELIVGNIKDIIKSITQQDLKLYYEKYKYGDIEELQQEVLRLKAKLEKKEKALSNAQIELEKIFMGDSSMDKDTINSIIVKLKDEVKQIHEEIQNKETEVESKTKKNIKSFKILEKYKDFEKIYDQAENYNKKMILQEIVDKIIIDEDKIEIKLNIW